MSTRRDGVRRAASAAPRDRENACDWAPRSRLISNVSTLGCASWSANAACVNGDANRISVPYRSLSDLKITCCESVAEDYGLPAFFFELQWRRHAAPASTSSVVHGVGRHVSSCSFPTSNSGGNPCFNYDASLRTATLKLKRLRVLKKIADVEGVYTCYKKLTGHPSFLYVVARVEVRVTGKEKKESREAGPIRFLCDVPSYRHSIGAAGCFRKRDFRRSNERRRRRTARFSVLFLFVRHVPFVLALRGERERFVANYRRRFRDRQRGRRRRGGRPRTDESFYERRLAVANTRRHDNDALRSVRLFARRTIRLRRPVADLREGKNSERGCGRAGFQQSGTPPPPLCAVASACRRRCG